MWSSGSSVCRLLSLGAEMAGRFGLHVRNYAWAELAVTVAGLMSFPILTRLLSVGDYGVMNLVASVLALTVALGKLGVQHAAMRSWAEVASGRSPHDRQTFESTVILGMLASGLLVTFIWAVAAGLIPDDWWAEPHVSEVMLLASPLIVVRVLDSALLNQLRAQERSAAMAWYSLLRRYAVLLGVVGVLWFVSRDLKAFYLATLAVELLSVLALLAWLYRREPAPQVSAFSRPLYGSLLFFGVPMLGSELASVVLMLGDRFIIQTHLDADSLGIYAASWNMCEHLRNALLGAMAGAAYPRCMHVWERGGAEALAGFLRKFLHWYVVAAAGLVAWTTVLGGELMAVLASQKYARGGEFTGWLMAGLAVQSVITVAAVGLYLAKRTVSAMVLVLLAGLLSLLANVVLIPIWGLKGSAIAVVIVFTGLCAAQMWLARRTAPVIIPWQSLLRAGSAATLAGWLTSQLSIDTLWQDLIFRSLVLGVTYVGLVLMVDRTVRTALVSWVRREHAT
jgi:O-antigen/teichoic acid export membrane protein